MYQTGPNHFCRLINLHTHLHKQHAKGLGHIEIHSASLLHLQELGPLRSDEMLSLV